MDDCSGFRLEEQAVYSQSYPSYQVAIISLGTADEEDMTEAFTPRFLRPCTNNHELHLFLSQTCACCPRRRPESGSIGKCWEVFPQATACGIKSRLGMLPDLALSEQHWLTGLGTKLALMYTDTMMSTLIRKGEVQSRL